MSYYNQNDYNSQWNSGQPHQSQPQPQQHQYNYPTDPAYVHHYSAAQTPQYYPQQNNQYPHQHPQGQYPHNQNYPALSPYAQHPSSPPEPYPQTQPQSQQYYGYPPAVAPVYPPAYGSGPATVTGYTPHMGYQLANQQGYSPATGYPPSGAAPSHYGDYSQAQPPANQNIPWTPTPQESSIIEKWFRSLDKGNTGQVGGLDVAKFLKRTELPRELLRDMWTLVDDQKCGSVDFRQFTVFVRLISLACSPTFTGQQVSISLYFSTSRVYVPLPSTLLSWGVDSSAAASVTLPVQQTPHSNLQEIEDEDFTDFAGAEPQTEQKAPYVEIDLLTLDDEPQLNGPLQISVEETAPQTTAQLAENNDDDFSEFTGAETVSSPPITSIADAICGAVMQPKLEAAIANPSVPDTRIGQEITIGELDDPGSLASPISAKRLNISGSNSSATSVNPVATAEIDDDDFTEFSGHLSQAGSITCPIVDTGTNSATNSVSMPMSAPPPMNNTMQSSNHLSAFDELVENDLKALEEEWDDFADATKASESIPQETITTEDKLSNPTVNNSIEKENPFNESVEDTHTEKLMELAGTGGIDNNGEAIENDDEFGDFEEHPISFDAVFTADNLEEKEVATPLDDPFIGIEGDQEVALERSPREDDAEEDFGNFESHPNENKAEVPAKEPEVEIDLLMLDDNDANLGLFTSASTKHFTPKTQQEIDLLDFLSEPMFDSAAPTTTLQPSTDFFAATSSGLPDQPSSIQNNSQPSKALTGNDDLDTEDEWTDFNDFSPEEKSGDGDPVRAPETIVAVSPSVNPNIPDDNISAAYSTASVATVSKLDESKKRRSRKSLSATDLEVLALQLSENYLYEEAYRCALQVQLLKRLKDLGEKKHALLQSELLDDVGRVSGEIAHLTRELSSPAEEEHWQNMIQNSSKGETLTDISTFVTDVNREKGEQFRKKFVHGMPPSSAPLIDRMKYFVVAKRSAKMIATVCTSHLQRPPQWMKLVSSVQQTVQQGIDMLTSYSKLSPHEQSAIKTHSKMSEYLEGILAIVEAGLLISVSCVEAMEHEAVAKNVFATCHLLLSEVQKYFGLKDKMSGMTIEDFIVQAGQLGVQKGIEHCHITLRPLAKSLDGIDNSLANDENARIAMNYVLRPSYETIDGSNFLKLDSFHKNNTTLMTKLDLPT